MTEPWMDPAKFGALYGGIGGGLLGSLCGVLGAVAGKLAPQGKGRGFILGAFSAMTAVGAIHLLVGLYALSAGQPYGIWYPLVLVGVIVGTLGALLRPVMRKRYEEAEMRKMEAGVLRRG